MHRASTFVSYTRHKNGASLRLRLFLQALQEVQCLWGLPFWLFCFGRRRTCFDRFAFHLEVGVSVPVGGRAVSMSQEIGDCISVYTRAQHVHGGRVTDRVRMYTFALCGRHQLDCLCGIFGKAEGGSIARESLTTVVNEDRRGTRLFEPSLLDEIREDSGGLSPQGRNTLLSSLTEKAHVGWASQADVAHVQIKGLLNAGATIIHQCEQSIIPAANKRRAVNDCEDCLHFFVLKVVNRSLSGPFLWDHQDSLALLENGRDIRDNDAEEGADSAEPLVSRNRTRPTVDFEVLKESQDHWCIKIFEREVGNSFSGPFGAEAKKHLNRVAIAVHRMDTRSALTNQVVAEEESDLRSQEVR
jgi:hypothetical protein